MSRTSADEVSIHAVSPLSIFDAAGAAVAAVGTVVAPGAADVGAGGADDWARTVVATVSSTPRMPSARASRFNVSPLASLPTRRNPRGDAVRSSRARLERALVAFTR